MALYYVDAAAVDDTGAGTELDPWKYIPGQPSSTQTGTVSSGDTVFCNRGDTWNEQLDPVDGVTYDAYGTGAIPIIDVRAVNDARGVHGLSLPSCIIRNFDIKGSGAAAAVQFIGTSGAAAGYGIRLEDCTIENISALGDDDEHDGVSTGITSEVWLENCTIRNCSGGTGVPQAITCHDTSKIYMDGGSIDACDIAYAAGLGVSRCDIKGVAISGITDIIFVIPPTAGALCIVDDCDIDGDSGVKFINGAAAGAGTLTIQNSRVNIIDGAEGIIYDHTLNLVNNEITYNGPDVRIKSLGASPITSTGNIYTITDAKANAFFLTITGASFTSHGDKVYGPDDFVSVSGVDIDVTITYLIGINAGDEFINIGSGYAGTAQIYNSTFYNHTGTRLIRNQIVNAVDTGTVALQNCIFHTVAQPIQGSGNLTISNNCYFNSADEGGTGSITDDPLFTNIGAEDFTLTRYSPCIDTGIDLGLTRDFDGNQVDDYPDMGAYEVFQLNILLQGDSAESDAWDFGGGTDWTHNAAPNFFEFTQTTSPEVLAQPTVDLVEGFTYRLYITAANTSIVSAGGDAYFAIQLGGGTAYHITEDQVFDASNPLYLVCGSSVSLGFQIVPVNTANSTTVRMSEMAISVQNFKPSTNVGSVFVSGNLRVPDGEDGPIDEYVANGTYSGKTKYTSVLTHPNGSGGSQTFVLWWDVSTGTDWVISLSAGTKGSHYWKLTQASQIGTPWTPVGSVTGTATTTNGPTDHTIATGSPGMETDPDDDGFIKLKTGWDYLNGLRTGKFGIISVYNVSSTNDNSDRILSSETADGVGVFLSNYTSIDSVLANFSGTGSSTMSDSFATDGVLHNLAYSFDVSDTRSYLNLDGGLITGVDTPISVLDAVLPTTINLGVGFNSSRFIKTQLAFTAILDYSSVTSLAGTWTRDLSIAINTAAVASNYDATTIANAIFAYDPLIAGVYWPLNEATSGDTSDYYLLARDIIDDSEFTSEFYGLVSPSGVTGVQIVEQATGGGLRPRYQGFYRGRYSGAGRY